jgi:hypothetical protein
MPKKKANKKTGPEAERLVIRGDWKDAVKTFLKVRPKRKPKGK